MKLKHLIEPLTADMKAIIAAYPNPDPLELLRVEYSRKGDDGKASLRTMFDLLNEVACQRAYDDTHPRYRSIKRVLPYDGRDHCFYYENGADDTHVRTLLRAVKEKLLA